MRRFFQEQASEDARSGGSRGLASASRHDQTLRLLRMCSAIGSIVERSVNANRTISNARQGGASGARLGGD
jgi:hypothetical protein